MVLLKDLKSRFGKLKHFELLFILLVFVATRVVSLFVFYNGFLINFKKITEALPHYDFLSFLQFIPYHSFSICLSSLIHPVFLLCLLLFYLPFIYKRKNLSSIATAFSIPEKLITIAAALTISWELSTYDYNYYLDNGFFLDRLILIVMPLIIWRLPAITPLYIAFALVYRSQFNYPVEGFELFDKRLLFEILWLYTAFVYARLYFPKLNQVNFIYLVLCIIASNYFATGLAKLIMSPHGYEWTLNNNISDLFLNVHQRGWLALTNETAIHQLYVFINNYAVSLQFVVLIIEIAAIFILRSHKGAIVLLLLFFFMHLGIFVFGSMLFWKWMLIDILLVILLIKYRDHFNRFLFSKELFLKSVVIIITSFIWLRPYTIGWFDTKMNQYFTYEAQDEKGNITEIDKNDFNPYHQWMQYDRFLFLVNKKCLPVSGFGYTATYQMKDKIDIATINGVSSLEEELGNNHYNQKKKSDFEHFIKVYFQTRNRRNNVSTFWNYFQAPNHLYSSVRGGGIEHLSQIKKVTIFYNTSYIVTGTAKIISKSIVDEIDI